MSHNHLAIVETLGQPVNRLRAAPAEPAGAPLAAPPLSRSA
jgi:hypothetical protein